MLHVVDKFQGYLIQKRTSPKGKVLGYQLIPQALLGDAAAVQSFPSLSAARQAGGFPAAKSAETKPKASYPQNQKGYDPHKAR